MLLKRLLFFSLDADRAPQLKSVVRSLSSSHMAEQLLNFIANDGSRQFGELPQTVLWYELRDHIAKLDGVAITDFITDHVTEAWIDFAYQGYQFSVNDQFGDYWFFVNDPNCPNEILESILSHSKLLLSGAREA